MKLFRVTLLNLNSMLLLHTWESDTLDGILCHHDQMLGSLGAPVVTTLVVDVKEIALVVNNTSKDCGMVPSLVELLV